MTLNQVNMNGISPHNPMAMANGVNGANANATGGGLPRAATVAVAAALEPERDQDMKVKLNTYIYDYLLRNEQWDVARALHKSSMPTNVQTGGKAGGPAAGGARRPNGMDADAMDEGKDDVDAKRPADLPLPNNLGPGTVDNSFLFDWFSIFWDIFLAPRVQRSKAGNPAASQFIEQTRVRSWFFLLAGLVALCHRAHRQRSTDVWTASVEPAPRAVSDAAERHPQPDAAELRGQHDAHGPAWCDGHDDERNGQAREREQHAPPVCSVHDSLPFDRCA